MRTSEMPRRGSIGIVCHNLICSIRTMALRKAYGTTPCRMLYYHKVLPEFRQGALQYTLADQKVLLEWSCRQTVAHSAVLLLTGHL